mmetsp:Transcript_6422/g.14101  ORF Transcript_6422/g.14101 Transcript_6422/m.14101 type:complete len:279 (+) Transcript_6422:51-887(+)
MRPYRLRPWIRRQSSSPSFTAAVAPSRAINSTIVNGELATSTPTTSLMGQAQDAWQQAGQRQLPKKPLSRGSLCRDQHHQDQGRLTREVAVYRCHLGWLRVRRPRRTSSRTFPLLRSGGKGGKHRERQSQTAGSQALIRSHSWPDSFRSSNRSEILQLEPPKRWRPAWRLEGKSSTPRPRGIETLPRLSDTRSRLLGSRPRPGSQRRSRRRASCKCCRSASPSLPPLEDCRPCVPTSRDSRWSSRTTPTRRPNLGPDCGASQLRLSGRPPVCMSSTRR